MRNRLLIVGTLVVAFVCDRLGDETQAMVLRVLDKVEMIKRELLVTSHDRHSVGASIAVIVVQDKPRFISGYPKVKLLPEIPFPAELRGLKARRFARINARTRFCRGGDNLLKVSAR